MSGIYVHIPFCKHKCTYCDFTSFPNRLQFAEAYMACLYREMEMRSKELERETFDTVYIGGGTPSVIDPNYLCGAVRQARKKFHLAESPEITVEMNPGTVSEKKIAAYKSVGVNRFSIGLQTAIDEQLRELGRIHTARDYLECTRQLKGENFSADMMLGLRGQTKEDIRKTVALIAGSGASHVSAYALTPEDGTPIYTQYLNGELPDADEVAELYEYARGLLEEEGYSRYEVSNFARPGRESRHNLNYWRRGEYIGFGVSASSFFYEHRFTNTFDLDEYIKCILTGFLPVIENEAVTQEDAKFEFVMLALRTAEGLSSSRYKEAFGTDWRDDFAAAYKKTEKYLETTGDGTRIKPEYLFVQNQILIEYAN